MQKINKNIPTAFICTVILIIVFEWINIRFDDYFYTTDLTANQGAITGLDGLRTKIKNEFSLLDGQDFDILIFGDSYYISGIIPNQLFEHTGLKTFNFASFGDHGVFTAYCLLKNYLDGAAKKPKYIILGYQPDTLSRAQIKPSYMYDLKGGNGWELWQEFGWKEALKFQIPTLKHQHFFQQILDWKEQKTYLTKQDIKDFRFHVFRESGFYSPYPDQMSGERVTAADYNEKYTFTLSQTADNNLHKLLDLAQKNDIEVYYLMPTYSEDWYELCLKFGLIDQYKQFLSHLGQEYPNLRVIDLQEDLKAMNLYADRLHLNLFGARRLTSMLAAMIQ